MVKENGMVMMTQKEYMNLLTEKRKREELEKRIDMLQNALREALYDRKENAWRVSRKDFVEIYNKEVDKMFEVGERGEDFTEENQKIYCHNVTVHWAGLYCDCGDGATPTNYIIPAIEGCDDEWGGDEW